MRGAPSVRRDRTVRIVRAAIADSQRDDFRIVEFNVLSNHLHLIVEATNQHTLARGMHGLAIRIAKRMNAMWSSAPWFDGWRETVRSDADWLRALRREPACTATARCWLLTTGWRRHGLPGVDEGYSGRP